MSNRKRIDIRNGRRKIKFSFERWSRKDIGSTTVVVVAMLPVVLLLLGLSVDAGRVMAAKAELYKASDVAAREIAEEIDLTEATETGRAINGSTDADAWECVEINLDGLSGAELLDVKVLNTEVYVEVESRARVPLLFASLIKKRSTIITVSSIGRMKAYQTGL
jgi:uncharacterized membrane protein